MRMRQASRDRRDRVPPMGIADDTVSWVCDPGLVHQWDPTGAEVDGLVPNWPLTPYMRTGAHALTRMRALPHKDTCARLHAHVMLVMASCGDGLW